MEVMNWVVVQGVSEAIASIAVVGSLLLVVIQLRSNNRTLRSAAYQALHDTEDGFYSDLCNDASLARIWKVGATGTENVPEEDQPQ